MSPLPLHWDPEDLQNFLTKLPPKKEMYHVSHAPLPQTEGQEQSITSLVPSSNLTYPALHPSLGKAGKGRLLEMRTPDSRVLGGRGGGLGSSALNRRDLSLSAPAAVGPIYLPRHPEQKLTSAPSGPALGKGVSVIGQLFREPLKVILLFSGWGGGGWGIRELNR